MYKQQLFQFIRLLLVITVTMLIFYVLHYALPFLYPFIIAFILAFILNPSITFFQSQLNFPRVLAILAIGIIIILFLSFSIFFIITELIQGTAYLTEQLPLHAKEFIFIIKNSINQHILPLYQKLLSMFDTLSQGQQNNLYEQFQQFINQLLNSIAELLQNLLLQIPLTLKLVPESFTVAVITVLATFFIAKDWYAIMETFKKRTPKHLMETGKDIRYQLEKAVFGYLKAQLLLIFITAFIIMLGLVIIQVDYALTIGLIAALVDIIPFIGTGIIFIPWILYLFFTANYPLTIAISALYMVVIIQRQVLEPKVLSSSLGLNPLMTLIALFAGIQIWGIAGVILGPLIAIVVVSFYQAGVFERIWEFVKG